MQPDIKSRLMVYHDLLLKWQKSVNLVAPGTVSHAWNRHFEDSMQLAEFIPESAAIVDMGSGAGFPGLVLGILRPDLDIHLIESDGKKCTFLLAVSRETGAKNVHIHNGRIEDVLLDLTPDIITARALAPLPDLLQYTKRAWKKTKPVMLLFMKGAEWEKEVDLARKDHVFEIAAKPSKTDPDAAILCITNVSALD